MELSITALLVDELGAEGELPELPSHPTEIPVGTIIRARHRGAVVAVARLASGRLVVTEDECPHDGGRISDGFVDGDRLVCARHGWELEVRDGRCVRAASCGNC